MSIAALAVIRDLTALEIGGDDFYEWFLGPRMVYTSGVITDLTKEESLEQLQDNKMTIVCEKVCDLRS